MSVTAYRASPHLELRDLVVNGVAFVPGILDDDDVATVLGYVVEQYAARVEPLRAPGCWGFSYRINRNAPGVLSNHARGIAIDVNAPAHPNGIAASKTFTWAQITEIRQILAEVDHVVRWGGDYAGTPDAMHFEINADPAAVALVAANLRGLDMDETKLRAIIREEVAAVLDAPRDVVEPDGTKKKRSLAQQVKETWKLRRP